jgi:hypothetical protein
MYKKQRTLFFRNLASKQSFFNNEQFNIQRLVDLKRKANFLSQALFLTSPFSNSPLSCFKENHFNVLFSTKLNQKLTLPKAEHVSNSIQRTRNKMLPLKTKKSNNSWLTFQGQQNKIKPLAFNNMLTGLSTYSRFFNPLRTLGLLRSLKQGHRPCFRLLKSFQNCSQHSSSSFIRVFSLSPIGKRDANAVLTLSKKQCLWSSNQGLTNIATETLNFGLKGQKTIDYSLDNYNRSNQDTCLLHRPAVFEGQWVQSGDLLADCASSVGGELALGQNLLIAYMPWEGYNYEDAILISERLVYDDLYTSVHIEKYELETRETKLGAEEITRQIPDIFESEIDHLDQNGIVKVGSWVEEGDILVGKTTPINKKSQSPYQKLLSTILEKDLLTVRDSSLRAPKGIRAKIVKVQLFHKKKAALSKVRKPFNESIKQNKRTMNNSIENQNGLSLSSSWHNLKLDISKRKQTKSKNSGTPKPKKPKVKAQTGFFSSGLQIHLYLAEKRKVQVGDKLAGRHGNKGIISQILPREDMPYLPDGTPIDMVLNPLGVPSRMNVGQIYECLLGLAGKFLGENYKVFPFDEIYGPEASRSFVYSKLNEARKKTGYNWIFDPNTPGKIRLYDGRTGDCFDQAITVGQAYILRLVHMVDDKIHCLTPEHEVLTTEGWLPIAKINLFHKIATLQQNGHLTYQNPTKIFHYSDYKGTLYHIKNAHLDLKVTLNHRMYVKKGLFDSDKKPLTFNAKTLIQQKGVESDFKGYQLVEAQNIIGQPQCYLKNANWLKRDYQFILPSSINNSLQFEEIQPDMNSWLIFFGIWMTKGCSLINQKLHQNLVTTVKQNIKNQAQKNFHCSPLYPRGTSHLKSEKVVNQSSLSQSCLVLENSKKSEFQKTTTPIQNHKPKTSYSGELSLSVPLQATLLSKASALALDKSNIELSVAHNTPLSTLLLKALKQLGYNYRYEPSSTKAILHNKQLSSYLQTLSEKSSNQFLPSWVWELSKKQARLFLETMMLANATKRDNVSFFMENTVQKNQNDYYTSSNQLADDLMRLALHAGWSGQKDQISKARRLNVDTDHVMNSTSSNLFSLNEERNRKKNGWRVSLIQTNNNPSVNTCQAIEQKHQIEKLLSYEGPVYCLSVPNEVFYVRCNGLPIWTGNSRSIGPYSLVTQQPLRGRSKQGGQRLGEMEVWALEGYGAAFTLLEMLTLKSDDMTGRMTLWSNLILNGEISIGTPESFKVLICELQALCLDIGLFRVNQTDIRSSSKTLMNGSSLVAVENLMNFK